MTLIIVGAFIFAVVLILGIKYFLDFKERCIIKREQKPVENWTSDISDEQIAKDLNIEN